MLGILALGYDIDILLRAAGLELYEPGFGAGIGQGVG